MGDPIRCTCSEVFRFDTNIVQYVDHIHQTTLFEVKRLWVCQCQGLKNTPHQTLDQACSNGVDADREKQNITQQTLAEAVGSDVTTVVGINLCTKSCTAS